MREPTYRSRSWLGGGKKEEKEDFRIRKENGVDGEEVEMEK